MVDLASMSAAVSGIKFIKDTLDVAIGYKIENESREKINAALKETWNVLDMLFTAQTQMFELQAENEQLRRQLKAQEDWENRKSQYRLEKTSAGSFVYVFTGEPKHYACPSCFSKESIHILQKFPSKLDHVGCTNCKTRYEISNSRR
jgi:hypothetical protein